MKKSPLVRTIILAGTLVLSWVPGVFGANDNFADATEITGPLGRVSGNNSGATKEPDEPNHAGKPGGPSVWYRWTAPASGQYAFTTFGSTIVDTFLAVYTGASVDALTEVASNDDFDGSQGSVTGLSSFVSVPATGGTTYYVVVDCPEGESGPLMLNWTPDNDNFADAKEITGSRGDVIDNSTTASREPGESPVEGGLEGGKSIWFRWTAPVTGTVTFDTEGSRFDTLLAVYTGNAVNGLTLIASNDDISGSISQSRVLFEATGGTVYSIVVDGYYSREFFIDDSGDVLLTWYPPLPGGNVPANDSFAAAHILSAANGTVNATNLLATTEAGESTREGYGGDSIWYQWLAPAAGLVTFDTLGGDFDTVLGTYVGSTVDALTRELRNDDIDNTTTKSRVSFHTTAGETYRIQVSGHQTRSGKIRAGVVVLNWNFVANAGDNDHFANAQIIAGPSGSVFDANWTATREPDEPRHADDAGGHSVWYRWRAPVSATVNIDTAGSTFYTLLAVYTGSKLPVLAVAASNAASGFNGDDYSRVSFVAVAGTVYLIAVDGYAGESGSVVLNWTQPNVVLLSDPGILPDGVFRMTLHGPPRRTIQIDVSDDLQNWIKYTSVFTTSPELPIVLPRQAGPSAKQFFRATLP